MGTYRNDGCANIVDLAATPQVRRSDGMGDGEILLVREKI